jgi:hypothetical protein
MTRLLFVINDSPQLMVDSPLPLDELITAINAGEWQFPAQTFNLPSTALHASRLGDLIIVAPVQPLEQVTPPANDVLTLGLSQRQRQVLEGIAEGLSSKQIVSGPAHALNRSAMPFRPACIHPVIKPGRRNMMYERRLFVFGYR